MTTLLSLKYPDEWKALGKDLLDTIDEVKKSESFGLHERDLLCIVLRSMIKTLYGVKS